MSASAASKIASILPFSVPMSDAKPASTTSKESIDALTAVKSALVARISASNAASISSSLLVALSISLANASSSVATLVSSELTLPVNTPSTTSKESIDASCALCSTIVSSISACKAVSKESIESSCSASLFPKPATLVSSDATSPSKESIEELTKIKSALVAPISAFNASSIASSLLPALVISSANADSSAATLVSRDVNCPSLLVICD